MTVTRITKNVERRIVNRLYRRVDRLERLLAKTKAELVARKRQYDEQGALWWVMFPCYTGPGVDIVTRAPDEMEAIENVCQRLPHLHTEPLAFYISKVWTGRANEPLDDDEVIAVAKMVEAEICTDKVPESNIVRSKRARKTRPRSAPA